MTKNEFLRELEGQLEITPGILDESLVLADLNGWDSLAAVVFMSIADEKLQLNITGDRIANAKTVKELLALLGDRVSG